MVFGEMLRDLKDNRYFRLLMYPYGNYVFKKEYKKYLCSEYPDKIRELRNKYLGNRCFIIGNGPSLVPQDLDRIKNEYSFGTNKIYKIFDRTDWRPSFYVCVDNMSILEEIASEFDWRELEYCFINWQQRKTIESADNILFCNTNPRYVINIWGDNKIIFSQDCSIEIDFARTVTYTAMELAVYMGFKEIYLLGVDANYPFYRDSKGKKHSTGMTASHFENGGYKHRNYMIKETNEFGYRVAKKYCDDNGIKIYNATRGGRLEIFERIEFEKIFK